MIPILRSAVVLSIRCVIVSIGLFFSSILSLRILRGLFINPTRVFYARRRTNPPAITLDKRYGVHGIVDRDVPLHYVANGRKGAPLVVLIHGFPECWWSWRNQLTGLAEDYYVVAFDMRGYCESGKPESVDSYHIGDFVGDVQSLIEHLGYEKCAAVIGHDWGGVVAWHFAIRCASMVEKLVILSAPHPTVFRSGMTDKAQIKKWPHMFYLQVPWLPELFFSCNDYKVFEEMYRGDLHGISDPTLMNDDDVEMYKYAFSRPGALTGSMNYYRAMFTSKSLTNLIFPPPKKAHEAPKQSRSNQVQPKTLILWGGQDVVLPRKMAVASQKFCDQSELRVFDNAGHWLQQHEPAAVNEAIKSFLSKQ